jgi:hypothetical protein
VQECGGIGAARLEANRVGERRVLQSHVSLVVCA